MNRSVGQWEWDDVRFFLAVAREGTLSGAARVLGVGHVTVGRRVAMLENRLGVKLVNRTPDGFTVTSAGNAILTQAASMEAAALSLERTAAGRDSIAAGSVRVATTEGLAQQVIAPAIAALRQDHPELQVDVLAGVRSLDISRREADLAVRFLRPSDPELICRKLGEAGYALYASPKYLKTHGAPKRGSGLAGHDLIGFTRTPSWLSFFMGESLEGARFATLCDNPLIQAELAGRAVGIAELACFLGDERVDLVRVWPDETPMLRPVWLIIHADMRRSARIKVVASAILEAFHHHQRMLRYGSLRKLRRLQNA